MKTIGIRATPSKIFYSIIDFRGDNFDFVNQDLIIPASFDTPQKLKYVRKTFLDIFNEYDIIKAGIRVTEYNAYASPDIFRTMLEGIIQELIASSKVEAYFTAIKTSITSKLGFPNDVYITQLIDGDSVFHEIPDWTKISKEYKECILTGFAAYKL